MNSFDLPVMIVTGARKGIGRFLVEYYLQRGYRVVGCSRGPIDEPLLGYTHFNLDVAHEADVVKMINQVAQEYGRLDCLLNNAGIASMNHSLLTPVETVQRILATNVTGTFLYCREAAKLMRRHQFGRIVNFVSVAAPLQLEGEAIYAASKAAVHSLTQILARELAGLGITVNAVGPTPIQTDLIKGVPAEKINHLIERQALKRIGTPADVANVVDFFLRPESDFITGQVIYLGGVS